METGVTSRRFEFNTVESLSWFFDSVSQVKMDNDEDWQIDFNIVTKKVTVKTASEFSMVDLDTLDYLYADSE